MCDEAQALGALRWNTGHVFEPFAWSNGHGSPLALLFLTLAACGGRENGSSGVSASVVGASGAAGSGLAGGSGAIASGTVTSSGADGAVPRDGGALAGPKCAPTPTKLIDASEFMANANGVSAAMDLAVSATDLYVAVNYNQGGAVLSVPTDGQNVYFAT